MTFKPFAIALFATAAVTGCKSAPAPQKATFPAEQAAAPAAAPIDPATTGSVTGTIGFAGKAPERVPIDTTMDPVCGMGNPTDPLSEQVVVDKGHLANVFVYVKSGPAAAMNASPANTAPVVLDQKGCVYKPHVIGVMRGGTVSFHNSDRTMHNVHLMGNETMDVSQGPMAAPQDKQFTKAELMIPVRCNNHPWMNAFINVSATPFFAVTDAAGHFDLKGLPAGDYTLGAVHEKLGEQTIQVTIKAQTAAKAVATFSAK
jgi:plastocyanin